MSHGMQARNILRGMASPLPCGIGMYEKYIPDDVWVDKGIEIMLRGEAKPVLYMQLVEENILNGFGQTGYEVCLPALVTAKQALSAAPLTEADIRFALSDLLVGLRQALSQSHFLPTIGKESHSG